MPESVPSAEPTAFNPLAALQSLLSPDVTPAKQRVRAAQQLEQHFRLLGPTPGLLQSYEPYLPLLTELLAKGGRELQPAVLALLQTLSSHNPVGFSDWIASHTQLGSEPWLVQWSYALLLHAEKQVPREREGHSETPEFIEFDRVFARVLHMWRTLLDHTADVALVDQLVKYLHALLMQQTERVDMWHALMLRKLQTHFVDIADVLIGWMMSTGPLNPLREEILTLLHHFGRLWADNSVFSLQLLNSFADEIVNLCDGWNEHQEGDDDRLSTLLACFMMVAQCVPELALPADEAAESPFARVLQRVASCPQPEYSIFCLANCSEYLVSMSSSRHMNFPPLSVSAVRFLLYHCAVQSRLHDSEIDKLSMVLKNTCNMASANFSRIDDPLLARAEAIGVLEDEIPVRTVKKGSQSKRVKVLECLFHLKCPNGITYITQLCLQLVRIGRVGALKVLGMRALQRLNGRTGEKGNSYFVFAATCFILASRASKTPIFTHDDVDGITAILELLVAKLEKQNRRHRQPKLTPRQVCLVLKMASAFIGTISQGLADRDGVVETVNRVSIQMLECATSMLPNEVVVVRDHRLSVDMLKVIETVLSRAEFVRVISHDVFRGLLKDVKRASHCSSVKIREGCVQVLKTLSSRAESADFAGELFEMSLDLILDPSRAVQGNIMSDVLSGLARSALLNHEKIHTPCHASQPLHPSFVAADFEIIMSLFQSHECDGSEWYRVCHQVMDRIDPGVTFSNSDVLLGAIRQAAAWCVQNRLRTHFGGPAQTFSSIERLLLAYSSGIQGLTGWTSNYLSRDSMAPSLASSHQLSKWIMLEFVSALEMGITHAVCTTDMDQNDPESEVYKSLLFFRTNKVVCDDWLNRIRPLLLDMSWNGTSYELCRYHSYAMVVTCYSKLTRVMAASRRMSEISCRELVHAEKDMDIALYLLCRCYCDAKDADSIIGFQKWAEPVSSALSTWYRLNDGNMGIEKEQCEIPLFRWLGAVRYEAEMRYEDAVAEYESILQPILESRETNPSSLPDDSVAKLFASPMTRLRLSPLVLLECFKQCAKYYAALREWTKLHQFIAQFTEIVQCLADYGDPVEGIQAIFDCSDMWRDEISTIASLNDTENELDKCSTKRTAQALCVWDVFNGTSDQPMNAASGADTIGLSRLKNGLVPLALQPAPWSGYAGEIIGKKAEETFLRMFGLLKSSRSVSETYQNNALMAAFSLSPDMHDSALWGQPFCHASSARLSQEAGEIDADCLHLASVASLARRQHNFTFARSLLKEAAALNGTTRVSSMAASYEKAKLLETIGMEGEGRRILERQCETGLLSISVGDSAATENGLTVQSLLHLATTFANSDSAELLSPTTSRFLEGPLVDVLCNGELSDQVDVALSSDWQDAAAHKCLQAAVTVSPASAKAWIRYSNWCYGRGKRDMARIEEQNGYIHLDPSDESEIRALLDKICIAEADRDSVIRAFCHFLDNGELIRQKVGVFHQLCIDLASPNPDSDAVDGLIQLQRICHAKVLQFYCMAARGYGKYLTVLVSDAGCSPSRQVTTMVALRILGLLTTYGAERDVVSALEIVFSNGPVAPWSHVVPQLLARAQHPVPSVSSLVCLILKRLAHHSPHTIVYPAVVDSMEPQTVLASLHEGQTTSRNTFAAVLQELQTVSPGQVEGVRLLVSELRRISILWDEAWISVLVKLSTDIARRTTTLEKEATRVDKNASLSVKEKSELAQRKLVAILKPILVSIEKLWNETCGGARDQHTLSPHERKFLKDFGGLIEKAMENFRLCCNAEVRLSPMSKTPQELWHAFAEILKALLNASGRKDRLPLHDISPAMASTSRQLAQTNMPGVSSGRSGPITIQRVGASVAILRTKTKPKSLEFIGSDGKTYKYLLKAREDLRLDERIMQFLTVTNDFLRGDDAAAARDLSAKNYSVIPLSRNAGLIQMVPDVVPLFQVYTSRNETQTAGSNAVQEPSSTQQQLPPPTAQFYAKLKQHGIENVSPKHRAHWPVPVLKQVYQELVSQRPRNVLQREILLRSEDLRESWTKTVRFSKSLAVMSVLGYIVGLGDRHLDNILLCIDSGDIVHIDHNVCFDKGRRLKVPEVVPFRLTPMLQDALGFTGVEGKFRVAFETTLRVVRSNDAHEALLTLFEAFVYSPLVDWITEDRRQGRSGDLKARLEANVNLSLFLSRAEERRQDTISFGRQYEQFADGISSVFTGTSVPFVTLLNRRELLQSLESEELVQRQATSTFEAELLTHQRAQQTKRAEVEVATAQVNEVAAKITSFANECIARHQQIEVWRQKSISFAELDSAAQLNTIAKTAGSASFQKVHATLCNVLAASRLSGHHKELLEALESKCRCVDTDVMRLRFEIERLANCLIPYLSGYGHWRKELDAYLDSELKMAGKDVYFTWWNRCTECLRGLVGSESEGNVVSMTCSTVAPSQESIAESAAILQRLSDLNLDGSINLGDPNRSNEIQKDSSILSQVDQLLQDVGNALSEMKLSNAQGQRLMKLAGASWIIDAMEKLIEEADGHSDVVGAFSPALTMSSKFQHVVTVSQACATLLELVSTPKGSMKRLRASEFLVVDHENDETRHDAEKGFHGFADILRAVGSFAAVLQEEFISNLHARQFGEAVHQELVDLVTAFLATPDGAQGLIKAIQISPSAEGYDDNSPLQTLLLEHPSFRSVFTAASGVVQKIDDLVEALQKVAAVTKEEAARLKSSCSASWIELVVNFIKLAALTEAGRPTHVMEKAASAAWSTHMDDFVSNFLVKLLRFQLSSIISCEWKFDFLAFANEQSDEFELGDVSNRWSAFFCSQLPNILPSTLVSVPNGAPETQAGDVSTSVTELMSVCEVWWTQQWRITMSDTWADKISSLRKQHGRRLRYATWLTAQPAMGADLTQEPSLTRIQLLTFLSSQVPHLNALLMDQVAVEASVLELAQQMDYLVSNASAAHGADQQAANESMHDSVKTCYGKVAALFEYGRALADLVQGVSVIETSTNDVISEAGRMELEVNAVGKSILLEAASATRALQSCSKAADEVDTSLSTLENEMKHKQALFDSVASSKLAMEEEFRHICAENEDAVLEAGCLLSKHVKEMRYLLKGFDKFKTPSKQSQAAAVASTEAEGVRRQRQLLTGDSVALGRSSPEVAGYYFMENDRLVKILLRSIRSVNHLQLLENVLERHGEASAALREAVTQIDQALRDFDVQADQLLAQEKSTPGATALPRSAKVHKLLQLLLDLIEVLRAVNSDLQSDGEGATTVDVPNKASAPLLITGRDLVRECVKLFFEATEMADRYSSAEDESRRSGVGASVDYEAEEEQQEPTDDPSAPLALESENSAVLAVSSDSGSSSHDAAVTTPQSTEEKSQYGLRVLKRIEEKLSGTVTEMAHGPHVLTVEQQASWLIDEATKTDNLCVMYEGWTPWI